MSVENDFCVCNHLLLHHPFSALLLSTSYNNVLTLLLPLSCGLVGLLCWLAKDRKMDTKLVEETIFIFLYLDNNFFSSSSSFTGWFIFMVCWWCTGFLPSVKQQHNMTLLTLSLTPLYSLAFHPPSNHQHHHQQERNRTRKRNWLWWQPPPHGES